MGDRCGFDPCGYTQLAEDVRDVVTGGLLGDEEDLADLPVRPPVGYEYEYLELALGQAEL
jgi:hypothetical protein